MLSLNSSALNNGNGNNLNGDGVVSPDERQGALARLKAPRISVGRRGANAAFHAHGHATDTIERAQDKWGNPIGRVHVFLAPALGDEKPVADTRLKEVLELLAQRDPMTANALWRRYDNVVLWTRGRFIEARRVALEEMAARQNEAARFNAALEARAAQLEEERDAATLSDREKVVALDEPLALAHLGAGQSVALAGGAYDPGVPSPSCVLRHEKADLRALAGRHAVPFAGEEVEPRHKKWWVLAGAAFTGLVLGSSFGVGVGIFNPKLALKGHLAHLIGFGLMWPVGTWFALKIRDWVKASFEDASERYWLGLPARNWVGMWAQSLGFAFALLAVLCLIEQYGLLKLSALIQATGAGGQVISGVGALAMGLTSAFFIGAAAWEGIVSGKNRACHARLIALQKAEWEEADANVRADERVQEALRAIVQVQELNRQKADLEARIHHVAAPFDAQIAELQAQHYEPQEELDAGLLRRLQNAYDDWFGANADFEARLERAIQAHEGSFGQRLKTLFRPRRSSRKKEESGRE